MLSANLSTENKRVCRTSPQRHVLPPSESDRHFLGDIIFDIFFWIEVFFLRAAQHRLALFPCATTWPAYWPPASPGSVPPFSCPLKTRVQIRTRTARSSCPKRAMRYPKNSWPRTRSLLSWTASRGSCAGGRACRSACRVKCKRWR